MTREEFMDIVYYELDSDDDNYRANRIIDAADEYAENSSSENPNKWIPVSEEYPKRSGTYWVTTKSGIRRLSAFYMESCIFEIMDVIAWTPLIIPEPSLIIPEPYKTSPTGAEGSDKE